jgi:hypothetical protein
MIKSIRRHLFDLRFTLINERQQRLGTLAVNSIMGIVNADAMAFGLCRMQRLVAQK